MAYQVIIRLSCQLNKTFNIPNIVLMHLFPQCCDGIPKYRFSVDNNKVELGYISKSREGGTLHVNNTLLHGAFKAATFHQRQPSQAQRLKSGNRWQLGGGFNNRGAGLRIHSCSFIYLFYIFLQPTANYSIKARNNSNFSLEFCKRSSLSMSASNLVLLGAQMSHFWGMCRHLFNNIRGLHTYTCPQHSLSVHQAQDWQQNPSWPHGNSINLQARAGRGT